MLLAPDHVKVTACPASPAAATSWYTVLTLLDVVSVCKADQPVSPEGPLIPVVPALLTTRTRPSPDCTPAGTCTVQDMAFALLVSAPRKLIPVIGAVTVTDCVLVAIPPRLSVTV